MGSVEGAAETRKALEHINRIYQRYILPALEFLDPKTRFKQGIPAVTAIRRIAKLTADSAFPSLNEELQLSANAIHSYVNDIDALRLSLERIRTTESASAGAVRLHRARLQFSQGRYRGTSR